MTEQQGNVVMADRISDESRFTLGDCYLLALAIHRRTGWKLCGFHSHFGVQNDDDLLYPDMHSFVETPCGRYMDVTGVHDYDDFLREWDAAGILPATKKETLAFGPVAFGPYSYKRAAIVADRLIASYRSAA